MKKYRTSFARMSAVHRGGLGLALLMIVAAVAAQNGGPRGTFDLSWNTIDSGGGTSTGGGPGGFKLSGTIGQHDAGGPMTGGTLSLTGGFWSGGGPDIETCPADIDPPAGDGQVNIDDLFTVIAAWGMCPMPCPPYCQADIDDDCDVDIDDLFTVIATWGSCS